MKSVILAGLLASALALEPATAGSTGAGNLPVPGLFNTGVDAGGAVLGDGAIDPHYRLVQSSDPAYPGPDAYAGWPIASGYWLANDGASRWITPAQNEGYPSGAPSHPDGPYTYRLTFDLTGLDPATVSVSGGFAADNAGSITLNGQGTSATCYGYGFLQPFTLTSGFVSGLNTLDFVVGNAVYGGTNPTGLRVEGLAGTGDSGLTGVGPVEPNGSPTLALAAPAPNPARGGAELALTLVSPAPGWVRIEALDVRGRALGPPRAYDVAAGPNRLRWDVPPRPGLVILRAIDGAGRVTSARVVVLR